MSEKIRVDGFHLELIRHQDECLKAAKWLRAKQNAVSIKWIQMALQTSKCRDMERHKDVLPLDGTLWKFLGTLSKKRLESWIEVVNEITDDILRFRYQRSLCRYDYKEESRRKRDALESEYKNIKR